MADLESIPEKFLKEAAKSYAEANTVEKAFSIPLLKAGHAVLPTPVQEYIGDAGQGAKVVGSKFMDWIGPLAKPWGAAAGAWDATGEFPAHRIYWDDDLGRLNIRYFDKDEIRGSLDRPDEYFAKSNLERIKLGAAEGWREPFSKNMGDEFSSLYSPDFRDTTVGKILAGATEFGVNALGDPLNIISGLVSVPYKIGKTVLSGAAKSKAGRGVLESSPVRSVLEALNVYTGDAAKANRIVDALKRKERGAQVLDSKTSFFLNKELKDIAKKAGVTVDDLKNAILNEVEKGTIHSGRLAGISPDAVTFAENQKKFYQQVLAAETKAGIGTSDILTAERSRQLGIGGYFPHVSGPGATLNEKLYTWYRNALPSSMRRLIPGTINEINRAAGRLKLLNDPVMLRELRHKWSRQVLASHRLMDDAKSQLGTKLGADPPGFVQTPGARRKLFDESGNPLPDDFEIIPGMEGYAFPKEGARILQRFFGNAKNPHHYPDIVNAVVKSFDSVQNYWKKYTLGLRPAWHTRNAFTNFWNNWFIGGLKNPIRYGQAAAIQKAMQYKKGFIVGLTDKGFSKLTGKSLDPKAKVSGTGMTREEIWNSAVNNGVYEAGFYGSDIPGQLGKSSWVPFGAEGRTINKAFAAGKAVENNARLALFIERLSKGDSVEDAASMVRKALFDYADLSEVERMYMKRLMPFYTWTRKNIPAQVHAILEHPDRANKLNLLVGSMQEGTPKIDSEDVEKWAKDQFPIFLSSDESEGVYTFITAMATLPTAELNKIFTDPKTAAKFIGEMGTPLLKYPLELYANWGTFKHRPIDRMEVKGRQRGFDWGEGTFKSLPGKTGTETFLGIKVTPKQKHLLQAIVLLGEIDRANPFGIFGVESGKKSWAGAPRNQRDLTPAARLIRAALGGRLYQRDIGAVKMRKMRDLMREYELLEKELDSSEVMRNPELIHHVRYLINNVIDEIQGHTATAGSEYMESRRHGPPAQ